MSRQCANCTLCCTLLPVRELDKGANEVCIHQKRKGCGIYPNRPLACKLWSCMWLQNEELPLPRPDKAHYVIDPMPDYVTCSNPGEEDVEIPAIQVWVDPLYPNAHRDPFFRAWLLTISYIAIIRYDAMNGFTLMYNPETGKWIEHQSQAGPEHTPQQIIDLSEKLNAPIIKG